MILIGSNALQHWFPNLLRKQPEDIDYIVEKKHLNLPKTCQKTGKRIEYYENPIIWELYKNNSTKIISSNDLYTLKFSHIIGWDIKWKKNMFHLQRLQQMGCKLNINLFNELYQHWNEIHGKNKRSDLEMSAEEFFNNALPKTYSHDWLHTLINPYPTYNKILKDGAEVEVSEEKFNILTHQEKCDLVREEVYVMGWERYKSFDYREAYNKMLKKFIINHAPLYEAKFILQNYIELHKPEYNFIQLINEKIKKDEN